MNDCAAEDFAQCLSLYQADLSRLKGVMKSRLNSEVPLMDEMQDTYFIGGKQLRAIVALLSAQLHGLDTATGDTVATAIEFIHTATLLHDDVVDDAVLRRHLPTAKQAYGNEAAVLAGDFLYSRASQLFTELGNTRLLQLIADVTNQLAEGELLQLLQRGKSDLSEADYFTIIRKKTANLFAVTAAAAAVLTEQDERAAADFGLHLGMAFQLVDDCLDYESDDSGKNLGTDLKEGKMTLPVIVMLARADKRQRRDVMTRWQNQRDEKNADEQFFAEILTLMTTTDALPAVRQAAQEKVNTAIKALVSYPDTAAKQQLIALAQASVQRRN